MVDMELVPGDVLLLDPEWIEDKESNEVRHLSAYLQAGQQSREPCGFVLQV